MKKGFDLEAEGGEIVIRNTNGDYAVIPKNKVGHIQKLLDEECYGCIDEYVSTLPSMEDYAQEGTVVGDPLTPSQSVTPPPPIQSATITDLTAWETDYNRRRAEYANNPKNKGVPTLGGNWRVPTSDERVNLIKYYESLPPNTIRNDQLEEYQSLLNNTYFVGDKAEVGGNFSKYIYAPTDIRQAYQTQATPPAQSAPTNAVPNTMLNQGQRFVTLNIAKSDNPNAMASFKIAYNSPEDAIRIKRDFANIKTEADLKKSPYYQYVGDDYTKTPTTPIDFTKL